MLRNVEKEFADGAGPLRPTIIGIDPGEVYIMTATKLNPYDNTTRESIRVRRSFLYRPYLLYRHLLRDRKAANEIDFFESNIPPMTINSIGTRLNYLESVTQDGVSVRETLLRFYEHKWVH